MTNSSIGVACFIVLCSEVGLYQGKGIVREHFVSKTIFWGGGVTVVQGKGGVASIGIS